MVKVGAKLDPMLCQKCTIEQARELVKTDVFVIQRKVDGVRAFIENGRLFDRRGKEITQQFPEFTGLSQIAQTIDGEIVAQSGDFNDISGRVHLRDKFRISLSSKKIPAIFMAFDMPEVNEQLQARLDGLKLFAEQRGFGWLHVLEWFEGERLDERWNTVQENAWEGLVMKRVSAKYQPGVRSNDWLKIKAFIETQAEFVKYEVHPKGVTIETVEGRRVVVNGAQSSDVVAEFKQNGKVIAEIQYLPQKDSDAWRFPSFRKLVLV